MTPGTQISMYLMVCYQVHVCSLTRLSRFGGMFVAVRFSLHLLALGVGEDMGVKKYIICSNASIHRNVSTIYFRMTLQRKNVM